MNKREMSVALAIATSGADLSGHDDGILFGCGLPDFAPVATTLEVCARHIRWQCFMLNGQIDYHELNETFAILRRAVSILNPPPVRQRIPRPPRFRTTIGPRRAITRRIPA